MGWDVLWLVAGGFALGLGIQKTGLAEHLLAAIPFASWPAFAILIGASLIAIFAPFAEEVPKVALPPVISFRTPIRISLDAESLQPVKTPAIANTSINTTANFKVVLPIILFSPFALIS